MAAMLEFLQWSLELVGSISFQMSSIGVTFGFSLITNTLCLNKFRDFRSLSKHLLYFKLLAVYNSSISNVEFFCVLVLPNSLFSDDNFITCFAGFSTTKGGLIRSILNPKPVGFKFFRDSMRFIGILAILGKQRSKIQMTYVEEVQNGLFIYSFSF